MPHIIVTTDPPEHGRAGAVMLWERVTAADFESDHFTGQLMQRLCWAVGTRSRSPRTGAHPPSGRTLPTLQAGDLAANASADTASLP
jgi:hypothetical protein